MQRHSDHCKCVFIHSSSHLLVVNMQDSWNLKVLAAHDGDDPATGESLPNLRHHGSGVTIYLLDTVRRLSFSMRDSKVLKGSR